MWDTAKTPRNLEEDSGLAQRSTFFIAQARLGQAPLLPTQYAVRKGSRRRQQSQQNPSSNHYGGQMSLTELQAFLPHSIFPTLTWLQRHLQVLLRIERQMGFNRTLIGLCRSPCSPCAQSNRYVPPYPEYSRCCGTTPGRGTSSHPASASVNHQSHAVVFNAGLHNVVCSR